MATIEAEHEGFIWETSIDSDYDVIVHRSSTCLNRRKVLVGRWDGEKLVVLDWKDRSTTLNDISYLSHVIRIALAD